MAAAVAAGFIPPALVLIILAVTEPVSISWVVAALVAGGVAAGWSTLAVVRVWASRAERIEAVAASLEKHEPPPHLIPDERDAMGRAERRLLDAADAVADEMESLAEQRDEFEAILRSMTEAVVVTGSRGEVVLLNEPARRMFALSPDANYNGRDFVELCRDPRLQEFVARATASGGGQVTSAEIALQTPAPRHVSASAAPVRRSGAGGAAWVFVFHDITQLKSYETQRADFVANLTHEIRTPLSALYGYAETLIRGVDDPDTARRFLGIIEHQARRLSRLIDDLISLSDLEHGLTPLKLDDLDAGTVLKDAEELMREQAQRKGVELSLDCPDNLPPIRGDRDRLHQVMVNLLDNAIKYTPRGGNVVVSARAATSAPPESRPGVELAVSDTGEGIPAADIPRLTERFYRVDRARSRELGGTGLGLAIVKHIVQLHGGSLRIESRLREGTRVTVWIPAAAASVRSVATGTEGS
jgi:two-component system phosphate regulon sensor histidine kinase PhoR